MIGGMRIGKLKWGMSATVPDTVCKGMVGMTSEMPLGQRTRRQTNDQSATLRHYLNCDAEELAEAGD